MKPRHHSQAEARASRRETPRAHASRAVAFPASLVRVAPVLDFLIILPR